MSLASIKRGTLIWLTLGWYWLAGLSDLGAEATNRVLDLSGRGYVDLSTDGPVLGTNFTEELWVLPAADIKDDYFCILGGSLTPEQIHLGFNRPPTIYAAHQAGFHGGFGNGTIIGFSEMLHAEVSSEGKAEQAEDLRRIHDSANHLLGLINDILDLMMPVIDGFTLLAKLRERPEDAAIPVIVITAMDLTEEQQRQLLTQTEKVFAKGGRLQEELLREVRRCLAGAQKIEIRDSKT